MWTLWAADERRVAPTDLTEPSASLWIALTIVFVVLGAIDVYQALNTVRHRTRDS